MCTQDTYFYEGCGCSRRNADIDECAAAREYPFKVCSNPVNNVITYNDRRNWICPSCRCELRRSVLALYILIGAEGIARSEPEVVEPEVEGTEPRAEGLEQEMVGETQDDTGVSSPTKDI